MIEAGYVAIAIGVGGLAGAAIALAYRQFLKRKMAALEKQKDDLVKEAEKAAASLKKEAGIEAKDIVYQAKQEAEREAKERRHELNQLEKRLRNREESLERKADNIDKRDSDLQKKERDYNSRERSLHEKESEIKRLVGEQSAALEKISGMSFEQARAEFLRRVEEDSRFEALKVAKRVEDEARQEADKKAKEIIGLSVQRYASEYVADATVSSVSLPSDDMKGRIIGREGRNIRALEAATGVDLIIDDTPEVVTLSAFDPVRREIARASLEKLLADGRIHPARIEEVVEKVRKDVESSIAEEGEKAVFDLGLSGIHPELVRLLGRLKYRTSYGQNVLQHSREVAYLAGMMAGELGVDVKLAKRAGLLHDIGKAIDHEVEGSHQDIGAGLARRHGENDKVVNAVLVHHGEGEPASVEAALVAAADALSAARPGVRSESIENYLKRLEKLEELAMSYEGVEKCFAIQAGREVRIIVKPDAVSDEMSWNISKELAKKIESEMTYPGQIKVTVIRESRYVEYAR